MMAELETLTASSKNWGSLLSTHMVVHKGSCPVLTSKGTGTYMVYMHNAGKNTHTQIGSTNLSPRPQLGKADRQNPRPQPGKADRQNSSVSLPFCFPSLFFQLLLKWVNPSDD